MLCCCSWKERWFPDLSCLVKCKSKFYLIWCSHERRDLEKVSLPTFEDYTSKYLIGNQWLLYFNAICVFEMSKLWWNFHCGGEKETRTGFHEQVDQNNWLCSMMKHVINIENSFPPRTSNCHDSNEIIRWLISLVGMCFHPWNAGICKKIQVVIFVSIYWSTKSSQVQSGQIWSWFMFNIK